MKEFLSYVYNNSRKYFVLNEYSIDGTYYSYIILTRDLDNPSYFEIQFGTIEGMILNSITESKRQVYLSNFNRRVRKLNTIFQNMMEFHNYFSSEFYIKNKGKKYIKEVPNSLNNLDLQNNILISWYGYGEDCFELYCSSKNNKIYHILYSFSNKMTQVGFDEIGPLDPIVLVDKWKFIPINESDKNHLSSIIDFILGKNLKLFRYK